MTWKIHFICKKRHGKSISFQKNAIRNPCQNRNLKNLEKWCDMKNPFQLGKMTVEIHFKQKKGHGKSISN